MSGGGGGVGRGYEWGGGEERRYVEKSDLGMGLGIMIWCHTNCHIFCIWSQNPLLCPLPGGVSSEQRDRHLPGAAGGAQPGAQAMAGHLPGTAVAALRLSQVVRCQRQRP